LCRRIAKPIASENDYRSVKGRLHDILISYTAGIPRSRVLNHVSGLYTGTSLFRHSPFVVCPERLFFFSIIIIIISIIIIIDTTLGIRDMVGRSRPLAIKYYNNPIRVFSDIVKRPSTTAVSCHRDNILIYVLYRQAVTWLRSVTCRMIDHSSRPFLFLCIDIFVIPDILSTVFNSY